MNSTVKLTFAFLILTTLIFSGCATNSPTDAERDAEAARNAVLIRSIPDSGAAQKIQAAKEAEKRDRVVRNINKAPDWFLNDEANEDTIFVTATETSPDFQLSIDMAMLSAKRLLTTNLGEIISSRMAEFGGQTSGSDGEPVLTKEIERVTKATVAEVLLKGYQRDRIQVVPNGTEYQTYVRLKYPTAELKKAIASEITKNALVAAKVRRTKAFEELEREIDAARGSRTNSQSSTETK